MNPYSLIATAYAKLQARPFTVFPHFRRLPAQDRRTFGAALIRAGYPYSTVANMSRMAGAKF